MGFTLTIIISKPLNFLGFARCNLLSENTFLWSREVETLFARNTSLDTVLSEVPSHIKEEVAPYKESFIREWPSLCHQLELFKDHITILWRGNSEKIFSLMDRVGIFYSKPITVFPVMPFFRDWPRSTPLSMPIQHTSTQKLLNLLIHEILHKTTEVHHPRSLWHYLSMVFLMKNITKKDRFLIQHAVIYVAASWIASVTLKKDFTVPQFEKKFSEKEQLLKITGYTRAVFDIFSSGIDGDLMKFAENIVMSCIACCF
ncbi:MAG: hypothetical protein PVF58_18745 [Candidatus Methanofastidiosia archaeon]|jgi:hypothetical protein